MKKFLLVLSLILSINAVSFAAFSDVRNYTTEINYLTSKGIINGYEDNTFRPEAKITRAELVKMIVSATGKTKSSTSDFSDVASNHWAKKYIDIAVANNLVKGDDAGTFRPEDNITYGEVATILVRAMGEERAAEKLDLSWPLNYIKEAEELKLFNGYRTNDLVADNEARRDNVALMVYNMLHYEEDENKTSEEITVNSKTAYAGFVTTRMERRGEPYVKVEDANGTTVELKLYKKSDTPEIGSFIIYQLTSDDELNLRSELAVEDVDNQFVLVESVEEELISLKGQSKLLDLELDKYTMNGKIYKLNKIAFFIIELDEGEFTDYELQDKDDLKLKKDDKIKFDSTLNVCYVIREK